MVNKITIPKLRAEVAPLQLPQIDIERNPFASVEQAAASITDAFEVRDELRRKRALEAAMRDPAAAQRDADAEVGAASSDAALRRQNEERRREAEENDEIEPGYSSEADRVYDDETEWAAKQTTSGLERGLVIWRRARYRNDARVNAMRAEAAQRARLRARDVDEASDLLEQAAYWDPENIDLYREEATEVCTFLDDEGECAARNEALNEAYWRGMIRRNPKYAYEMLRSRKGAADELQISEALREELEPIAEKAIEDEQDELDRAREHEAFAARMSVKEYAIDLEANASTPWVIFDPVIKAYGVDGKVGRRLEREADQAAREAVKQADGDAKVGRWIAEGKLHHLEELPSALDKHCAAVIGEDEGATADVVRRRSVGVARIVGRVPEVTKRRIAAWVHAEDPAERVEAGRLLGDLARFEIPGARDWAPDVLAFHNDFEALTSGGYSAEDAVKSIDHAKTLTPAQEEARGHHFDAMVDGETLSRALKDVLSVDVRDLVYRPERDKVRAVREPYRDDGSVQAIPLDYGSPFGGMIPGGVTPGPTSRDSRRYHRDDLKIIGGYRKPIQDVARTLGVSDTAIAGCIAEEMDDARGRGVLEDAQSAFKDWALGGRTHDQIAADYEAWERELAKNPAAGDPTTGDGWLADKLALLGTKWKFPATLDIGRGKIRVHTAIRMLREYNERYPDSDPLGIKKYNGAYDKLVADLQKSGSPATAAFAGLMVQEATRWFESKIPERWERMSLQDRDALIVEYYNQGREQIRAKYEAEMQRDGIYTPEPGDSGKRHRANAEYIRRVLEGYDAY